MRIRVVVVARVLTSTPTPTLTLVHQRVDHKRIMINHTPLCRRPRRRHTRSTRLLRRFTLRGFWRLGCIRLDLGIYHHCLRRQCIPLRRRTRLHSLSLICKLITHHHHHITMPIIMLIRIRSLRRHRISLI